MLTVPRSFASLIFSLLLTFVKADIFADCPGQLQSQDGTQGFGSTYRNGNRVLVNKITASSFRGFHYQPDEYHGNVELEISIHQRGLAPHEFYKYSLMLVNNDSKVRHLQLAISAELEHEPLVLYTIEGKSMTRTFDCIVVGQGWQHLNITLQAF